MSFFDHPKQSFFFSNNNSQNNYTTESEAPKRKALTEINTNLQSNHTEFYEKEQMYIEPQTKNKFQGFHFVPNNSDWFDPPQYSPQNNFTEADDWPDFI